MNEKRRHFALTLAPPEREPVDERIMPTFNCSQSAVAPKFKNPLLPIVRIPARMELVAAGD
jgi:hypothetical protein